jgi:CheY-like chemotaxis protein
MVSCVTTAGGSPSSRGAAQRSVAPETRDQNRPEQVPAKPAPTQGTLTVLFVDDEPGLRKAVARYLNRNGIQVRAVSDGAEALKVVRTEDFDVIVSDIRMPGVGGRELLAGLRRSPRSGGPAAVFERRHGRSGHRGAAARVGRTVDRQTLRFCAAGTGDPRDRDAQDFGLSTSTTPERPTPSTVGASVNGKGSDVIASALRLCWD